MTKYIGFDFGGTTIKPGVVNEKGEIIEKTAFPTPKSRDALLDSLMKTIKDYQQRYQISAIGISSPGIVQSDGRLMTAGAITCLNGVNLKPILEKQTNLPVSIENDANAAAIAEHWIGAAQGVNDYLCLVLGTGVGGGIVINGQIYRGRHGMAGEFGWMVTKNFSLTENMENKSLNATSAVVDGLCLRYTKAKRQIKPRFRRVKDARIIFKAASDGDKLAQSMLEEFYHDLSVGLIDLMACFDPELILIGGGISASAEFADGLITALSDMKTRHKSLYRIRTELDIPVIPAKLSNDAGLIGAVYQSFHK